MADLGFWNFAKQDPEALALVTPEEELLTRGELAAEANRLARGLRSLGLETGDSVAVVIENGRAFVECYLACFQTGLYLVPINHHLAGPEISYIVENSEAKVFIGSARFEPAVEAAAKEMNLPATHRFSLGALDGFRPFAELKDGQSDADLEDEIRTAGAVMNYTSGTTGKPKGVRRPLAPLDPNVIGAMFTAFHQMFGITPENENVHITGSPLYHTAVLMFAGSSMHLGHTVVLMDKWKPEDMLRLIDKYRVTTSHMVPTQFNRLLQLPEDVRAKYDCSSTRAMVHAAAPCPIPIKQQMLDWWGDSIWEYYAATEGGGTIVAPAEWRAKPGTVGKAWPTAEVKIFDEEGKELPAGESGTVYMLRGQADFEYYKDKDKTAKARMGNYFTVGDIGYLDEDAYLFLNDRKNDMIISGGVNIYPAEIESTLITHPKVGDVAVFGIPHADWGEEVKAVIEPLAGAEPGPALTDEILTWAADKLAKYKTPKSIDYIEEMPRDPNGKLYKRKLRDPYWEGQERSI
jgi:long-chain acyl-CoA synthetase